MSNKNTNVDAICKNCNDMKRYHPINGCNYFKIDVDNTDITIISKIFSFFKSLQTKVEEFLPKPISVYDTTYARYTRNHFYKPKDVLSKTSFTFTNKFKHIYEYFYTKANIIYKIAKINIETIVSTLSIVGIVSATVYSCTNGDCNVYKISEIYTKEKLFLTASIVSLLKCYKYVCNEKEKIINKLLDFEKRINNIYDKLYEIDKINTVELEEKVELLNSTSVKQNDWSVISNNVQLEQFLKFN